MKLDEYESILQAPAMKLGPLAVATVVGLVMWAVIITIALIAINA